MQRFLISCLSVFALSTSAWAARGPAETVSGFYDLRLANHSFGAPTGQELADFSAYLGPELVCFLGASLRYNEKFSKSLPEAKAPFAEGDLFSSAFDVPTRFELGPAQISGGRATVKVHFYHDQPDAQDSKGWDDVVQLAMFRSKWLITDVEYAGGQVPGNSGQLQENLRKTLSEPAAGSGWDARELSACQLDPAPSRHSKADRGRKASKGGKHGRGKDAGKSGKSGKAARGSDKTSAKAAHNATKSAHAGSHSSKSTAKSASSTKKTTHKR